MINKWDNIDLIKLSFLKNFRNSQFKEIVSKFKNFDNFFESDVFNQLFDDNLKNKKNKIDELASSQIELTELNKCQIITIWDEKYPNLLKLSSSPPIILFIKGKLSSSIPNISIVGTRKHTHYGKLATEMFVHTLVENNIAVVSGLAYGIDTISHLTTVKDQGITYAILPSSIDKISPSISHKNAEKIVDNGGALISEYRFGIPANLASFPQRNRIIAGISIATIVIECGLKSGALITAKIAQSESREVFAVPGNINSNKSEGTNRLIKDNLATIAISPENVLEELGLLTKHQTKINLKNDLVFDNEKEKQIYEIIEYKNCTIDEIYEKTQIEVYMINSVLFNLELKGMIQRLPGQLYSKVY